LYSHDLLFFYHKKKKSSQIGSKAPEVMVDDTVHYFQDHIILNILNWMDTNPCQFNILAG